MYFHPMNLTKHLESICASPRFGWLLFYVINMSPESKLAKFSLQNLSVWENAEAGHFHTSSELIGKQLQSSVGEHR